jgi:phage tail sheath protein FI
VTIYPSPGVYVTEVDLSQRIDGAATSIGAVVFESKRGPLAPTLITGGRNQFLDLYGFPDASVSYGHDTALAFLKQSGALFCRRVVNGAKYAGVIFYQDKEINPTRTLYTQFPQGLTSSYLSGNHKLSLIRLNDKLLTGNTIAVEVSDGLVTETATATYTTSNNNTLDLFAAALQTKLNLFASGGLVKVVNETSGNPVKTLLRLKFSAALVTSNVINANVVINGVSTAISPVTYATSSAATMAALAAALITAGAGNAYVEAGSNDLNIIIESPQGGVNTLTLTGVAVTGGASQATSSIETIKTGSGINDNRIITVIYPTTASLFLDNLNLSGSGAPTASIEENVELFEVFSENPGAWGNDYGVKIASIDEGIKQRLTLTISAALVTGNSITGFINNTAITTTSFATDSDTTLSNLATNIQNTLATLYGAGSAQVVSIPNSPSNDRVIEIVAPNSTTSLTLSDFVVSGGTSQATITIVETLANTPTTNTFTLEVYSRDNVSTPVESYVVSLGMQNDGFGVQQNISEVINKSASRSSNIRIAQQTPILSTNVVKQTTPAILYLAGGDDGAIATSAQVKQGWADFDDKERYDIRILLNAGYYDPSVQQYMISLAETRKDCIAVLDAPSDKQTTQSITEYRKNSLNINSSYGAFYYPDLLILDEFNNTQRFVPPSGYIGARYAYTDTVAETWFSPAGLNRGNIPDVIGLRTLPKKSDLTITYPNQINSIIQKSGIGYVVWGDKTLQAKSSALSFVSVRRLFIIITISVERSLDFSVFEPNDDFTRTQIVNLITSFLRPIQDKRGLQAFEVISDERNNKPTDIDAGILNLDIYITPTIPTQAIGVRLIVTKSGVSAADLNLT